MVNPHKNVEQEDADRQSARQHLSQFGRRVPFASSKRSCSVSRMTAGSCLGETADSGAPPPDVTMLHPQDGVLSKTGFHALAWRLILGHRPRTRASPPRSRPSNIGSSLASSALAAPLARPPSCFRNRERNAAGFPSAAIFMCLSTACRCPTQKPTNDLHQLACTA